MPPTNLRFERLPTVVARTGMSRSWIYKEVAAGRFPKPYKIGGASGWSAVAIDHWIEGVTGGSVTQTGAC
ncbi:helix-turn-helix transcriptional regulator [Brevundimonas sp.]|uniref:helix-turn-helix transcriptional regulator n=1 Tax=Brevundimonas sp. TaxID=1871086 RepID=UPI003A0FFEAA